MLKPPIALAPPAAAAASEATPRVVCGRCLRPAVVCVCALVPRLATRTRVLFLQHPRERRMPVGTARLAHLALPGSILRVGLDFAADEVIRAALATRPAPFVLFPGASATDVHDLPRDPAATLIVLDGTWSQARKLLRLNPALAALPRLSFSPQAKSAYHIRRQPADFCVSTIEALGEVLAVLEPEGFPAARLLDPFLAMVARQRRFAAEVNASRHRRAPEERVARAPLGLLRLRAARARIVCIHSEANAWPLGHPAWQPAETVHFVAHRLADGTSFEVLLRPRRPLAPSVPRHLEIDPARLAAGDSLESGRRAFAAFSRPDDVIVFWGAFARDVARKDGLLPEVPLEDKLEDQLEDQLDLRSALSQWRHHKAAPVERVAAALGLGAVRALGNARAGRRLGYLAAVVRAVLGEA